MADLTRCLITGATGYLGSHLCARLISDGHSVTALKRSTSSTHRLDGLRISIRTLDDNTPVENFFPSGDEVDVIVHSATSYGRAGESDQYLMDANVTFPLGLLAHAAKSGVRHFINVDTVLPASTNAYARTKNQFKVASVALAQKLKVSFINVKLEYMYGPRDDERKFPTYVIKSCLNNKPNLPLSLGEQMRDFVYIDDVVSGFSTLVSSACKSVLIDTEFELGSGKAVSLRNFAETARSLSQSQTRLDFGAIPYRAGELMYSQANTEKLERLGWKCEHSLESGIFKTIEIEK